MSKTIEGITEKKLDEIRLMSIKTFDDIGTEKSRQRVVFDMLQAVKSHNNSRFLWILVKSLNSYTENEYVKNLLNALNEAHIQNTSPENFEKMAYTIIMGIMSITGRKGGEPNGK